ncbi:12727_t:CDS:2 [Funneliformis geosporum]|uniref:6487_t:CDS:1 n=1 Tax=Funneliformis geosporum TaxID=1117311 RepID=A0A9W4SCT1_9GLOM|nr:12727_t:CDS:2 [Funneliformis geosporum]CAI2164205.1 6487_t:CDS:2 [Funneliformis geosporum]
MDGLDETSFAIETPFTKLSKIIPHCSKKIADHWWNSLDPRICHDIFSQGEKEFIYAWVVEHLKTHEIIQWKELQPEMVTKFGKFRSRNDLKNIWKIKKRQNDRITQAGEASSNKADISYILN